MTAAKKTAKKTAKQAVNVDVEVEAKPVHFVILVSLETDKEGDQYTVPRNIPNPLHRGDTVSYESADGEVTVKFDKDKDGSDHTSPYVGATGDLQTVEGGVVLNVVNKGTYFGKCSILRTILVSAGSIQTGLPENGVLVPVKVRTGWKEKDSLKQHISKQDNSQEVEFESGGNHIVRP